MTSRAEFRTGRRKERKSSNKHKVLKRSIALIAVVLVLYSCESGLTEQQKEEYVQQGNEIVASAGQKLSSTLTIKIQEGGIPGAVEFCNQSALPITSKMSAYHRAEIKRTSLKFRNPQNAPTEEETEVLKHFSEALSQGDSLRPVVQLEKDGQPHYYAPILTQKKCLMCHGELNRELSVAVDSIIKSRYPEDLATGYKEGDLRGMWSVTFEMAKP